MQLTLTRSQLVEEVVEIDFPLYLASFDAVENTAYSRLTRTRVDATGDMVRLVRESGDFGVTWSVERRQIELPEGLPRLLARHGPDWRSNATAFAKAVAQARAAIARWTAEP